jgi:WD40 repeat protein
MSSGSAKVTDTRAEREIADVKWPNAEMTGALTSPDGGLVALFTESALRVWNVALAKDVLLAKDLPKITGGEFSPDRVHLLTLHSDDSVRHWDLGSGQVVDRMALAGRRITRGGYSSDRKRIFLMSEDRNIAVWPLLRRPQDLVEAAKRLAPRCLTQSQRERFFLDTNPPDWCIASPRAMDRADATSSTSAKWPYDNQAWRTWLEARRLGQNVEMPKP